MNFLTKISLKNSVAVLILCLMVLSGGFVATRQIKLTEFPDVSFPTLLVQARYDGQSALEVEKIVTRPIEESMLRLQGVDKVMSTSADNGAGIVLAYPMGKNMEDAEQEVKDAIATLRLPEQVTLRVNRTSFDSVPVFRAAIPDDQAATLQDMLENEAVPAIGEIIGVSSVNLIGKQTAELRIDVDRRKAVELGVTLPSIQSMIASQNYAYPLGSVQGDNETMAVRLNGSLSSIDAIKRMELPVSGAGKRKATLSDIASITQTVKQNEITRYNGQRSFILEVYKTRDGNTAEVTSKVVNALDGYESGGQLQYRVIEDLGRNAEESVNSLLNEGLYGVLFTVLVILLFLRNLRATMIAILSLPISIFVTVIVLNQADYTLNMMTLGGLAVSVGRIVDDSIVVIENIFRWRKEKGQELSRGELVLRATKEVSGAVASSTFATVVVFLPLAFVGGIVGEFFRPFAITVASAILSSLLVAVIVIPVFGKLFLNKVRQEHKEGRFTLWFEKTMRALLRRKGWVLSASALLLVGSLVIVPLLGFAFLPAGPATTYNIDITLPIKTGLSETDGLAKKVEDYLHKLPEVESSQVYIGTSTAVESTDKGLEKYNEAHFTVQIKEGTDLDALLERENMDFTSFVTRLNADAKVNMQEGITTGPPQGNNIRIDLYADDLTVLGTAASQIENYMRGNDELKNVSNNLRDVKPQWVLKMNEAARTMDVEAGQIARAVGEQLRPVEAGIHNLDGKEWSVTLSYGEAIASKDELQAVRVPTAEGPKLLGEIADITQTEAPIAIHHQQGRISAQLTADIKGTDTAAVTDRAKTGILALPLAKEVEVQIGGGSDEIEEGFLDIGLAMGASVGLVFLVMSITFGGLLTPLVILSSLLFVPVGAFAGLLVSGQPLSVSSMIGLLMLIGIVVTNAVVLLDRVESNRRAGMDLTEAIIEGSKTRLRPILMTACATIFALLPLALSGTSGLISKGLAVTVIGGLTTSTLLTLVVVPVLYAIFGKYRRISTNEKSLNMEQQAAQNWKAQFENV